MRRHAASGVLATTARRQRCAFALVVAIVARGCDSPAMLRQGCVLLLLSILGACVTSRQALRVELDWAQTVLLGAESGDARSGVVRWARPVQFLVVDAPVRMQLAAEDAFRQLQAVLRGVHQLELHYVHESDPRVGQDGYVTIFAKAPRDAGALAEQYQAQPPSATADGWFTIVWNLEYELTRAVVFIDPQLDDHWLRHTVLEEMFQSLGPSNDSAGIRDSLVFEGGLAVGSHTRLARVDQQVLSLLYQVLRPGDNGPRYRTCDAAVVALRARLTVIWSSLLALPGAGGILGRHDVRSRLPQRHADRATCDDAPRNGGSRGRRRCLG